ncbi:prepilin peptidase [Myxococcota bacterium]|nr:prepilin peptidase [Myxococcota bacterium]MBU1382982.1 prepilin peptidase [Myxococcota bacterium]MBU1499181.1 prepilin peptidase [Myxococcota bacterium]
MFDFTLLEGPAGAFFAFLWGSIWGSFTNVVIYRLPRGESVIWPGSHCMSCNHNLGALDNIPVFSYIFLRGRCRYCHKPYSIRYALIELLSGLVSVGIFLRFQSLGGTSLLLQFACNFVFAQTLIALSFIDWDTFIIPDIIVVPLALLSLIYGSYYTSFYQSLGGMVLGGGLFAMITFYYRYVRKKEGLGLGDAKLLAALGAFLGVYNIVYIILLASIQGLLFAVIASIFKLKWPKPLPYKGITDDEDYEEELFADSDKWSLQPLPFGPFLSLAALEIIIFFPFFNLQLFSV